MAEQKLRDSAIQSIQNVFNYTENEQYGQRTFDEVFLRWEYLQECFDRFTVNHQHLLQRAIDAGNLEEAQEQRDLFERIEENYFVTRGRLQRRLDELRSPNQPEHEQRHSDEEVEEQNADNDVNNGNDDEESGVNESEQNIRETHTSTPMPPPSESSQFAKLVERMCMSMANKKENTWGKYDGDLSKWQGFHDAFTAAVHNDDLIAPTFKLQFLKSSLEGRAAREFGEWPGGNDNYNLAWEWLKKQNQQDYTTSKTILWRLMNFTKLERASGGAIQKLCTITEGVMRQLQAMKFPVHQYDMIIVHIVHDKLDPETSKDWELARKSENPKVKEITEFLQLRARALMYSQIGEKKSFQENRKRLYSGNEQQYKNKRAKIDEQNVSKQNDSSSKTLPSVKCSICPDSHFNTQCPKLKSMKYKERKQKISESNLCYNCLSPKHQVRDCPHGPCNRCKTKHNSLLCPENPYNKVANAVQIKRKPNKLTKKEQNNRKAQYKA